MGRTIRKRPLVPIVSTAINKGIDQESMQSAFNESYELFKSSLDNFAPAVAFTCGVGAVASAVAGVANVTLLMKASFFAVLAHLAYQNMQQATRTAVAPKSAAVVTT